MNNDEIANAICFDEDKRLEGTLSDRDVSDKREGIHFQQSDGIRFATLIVRPEATLDALLDPSTCHFLESVAVVCLNSLL